MAPPLAKSVTLCSVVDGDQFIVRGNYVILNGALHFFGKAVPLDGIQFLVIP